MSRLPCSHLASSSRQQAVHATSPSPQTRHSSTHHQERPPGLVCVAAQHLRQVHTGHNVKSVPAACAGQQRCTPHQANNRALVLRGGRLLRLLPSLAGSRTSTRRPPAALTRHTTRLHQKCFSAPGQRCKCTAHRGSTPEHHQWTSPGPKRSARRLRRTRALYNGREGGNSGQR